MSLQQQIRGKQRHFPKIKMLFSVVYKTPESKLDFRHFTCHYTLRVIVFLIQNLSKIFQ